MLILFLFQFSSCLLSDIDRVLSSVAGQSMKTAPGQVLREIVKQNKSFLVKSNNNRSTKIQFSEDTSNLCRLHSFKFVGIF